jgi:hypothetical protein
VRGLREVLTFILGEPSFHPFEGHLLMMRRREFIAGLGAAAWPLAARSQTYPSRPARIIIGFAAGGGADIVARLMGPWLSERLGHAGSQRGTPMARRGWMPKSNVPGGFPAGHD